MTESPVPYRNEYVSGCFLLTYTGTPDEWSGIVVNLLNRGESEQHARLLVVGVETIGNPRSQILYDSGDLPIAALSVNDPVRSNWGPDTPAEEGAIYWARILVTSLDLVPSASVVNKAPWETDDEVTRFDNYFAPGDFAVFDVREPPILVGPPVTIGPAK